MCGFSLTYFYHLSSQVRRHSVSDLSGLFDLTDLVAVQNENKHAQMVNACKDCGLKSIRRKLKWLLRVFTGATFNEKHRS